jgi:hypothetical protein
VKAANLSTVLKDYPESKVVVNLDGQYISISKVKVSTWTDGSNPPSFYSEQDVLRHKKLGNDIGSLRKLRKPRITLVA